MTDTQLDAVSVKAGSIHWKRNLTVALIGSFTTIVAMTLLLPFLPLYVEELGVADHAAIVQWSGIAYGATFLAAALVAPLWGRLGDIYGRKLMLVRASLGMTVAISLMGMAGNVWQLMALRLFVGLAGGYSSGSMVLVATQTPKERSAWALGVLSCGIMAGNLVGPLIGGVLPPVIGIRGTFLAAGAMIFLAFLATALLIKEEKSPARKQAAKASGGWISIPDKGPVVAMLATGALLMFANMSIEPIITVYVAQIVPDATEVTKISGLVMSAAALGSILSASRLGRLADRIGHWPVISGALAVAGLLLIPQAFVTSSWQLIVLRFLMGAALGGLLPCIAAVIRHSVPDSAAGSILGLSVSSQYVGQVAGPILGGFVGGHVGMRAVFLGTAVLLLAGGAYAWIVRPKTTETGAGSASRAAADQFDA
ncbi:multidrug resistance protein MdtG [Rhizobium phaseoli]|uniref:multidrug efflux MFS transporter n=1 Tax=Rhizobium TaxID=379 RepID=UPI0001902E8B|nr:MULTISPECIES: multidrug efflux MFS transporter [Rhizobium]MDH6649156.1 MFS family permease [Rhizobium esperanzae]ANL39709.1 multidrug resistance protein MdtG [Rhizobium phaseoli]ANL52411.1 multidrug resistance protein MdtG [Rhizobium phaseoli]ANL58698.1 multidrug resistance protein MdtG [Rhizobium phaseoli]ANL71273.1 multidrug resistance protein MdtG [Rhizobium phaseoli]